mmetsp:Transcript_95234/g.273019  ORF Transcript_95234/g.273019 Transcript_95234/m.273019 type:complete len:274 (+) Transcript_95234:92-913(+)
MLCGFRPARNSRGGLRATAPLLVVFVAIGFRYGLEEDRTACGRGIRGDPTVRLPGDGRTVLAVGAGVRHLATLDGRPADHRRGHGHPDDALGRDDGGRGLLYDVASVQHHDLLAVQLLVRPHDDRPLLAVLAALPSWLRRRVDDAPPGHTGAHQVLRSSGSGGVCCDPAVWPHRQANAALGVALQQAPSMPGLLHKLTRRDVVNLGAAERDALAHEQVLAELVVDTPPRTGFAGPWRRARDLAVLALGDGVLVLLGPGPGVPTCLRGLLRANA